MTHEKLETAGRACASRFALHKILLRSAVSSFRSLKVFYDCSGGNSRPSRPSGVGGGNFFRTRTAASFFLLLLVIMLLLDCALKRTPNAQRRTSNVEVSKPSTHLLASRIHTNRVDSRDRSRRNLFASRDLAGAHGTAKHN